MANRTFFKKALGGETDLDRFKKTKEWLDFIRFKGEAPETEKEPFPENGREFAPETPTEPIKPELSTTEKSKIAKENVGRAIDKYGNISPPLISESGSPTEEGKQRIFDTQELAAGAGISTRDLQAQQAAQQQRTQRLQQLDILQKEGLLTQEELQNIGGSDINLGEVAGAVALGAAPGLATAAGGFALSATGAGAVAGVPLATIGLIAAGKGALDAWNNGLSNIRSQQAGEFAVDKDALRKGTTALTQLITDTNTYPQNAETNIEAFHNILNGIDMAHAKTWADSQENLNIFQGQDGTPELGKFENFNDFLRPTITNRFNAAVFNPDPNKAVLTAADYELINNFLAES